MSDQALRGRAAEWWADRWTSRADPREPEPGPAERRLDLRLVPVAAAAWAGSWVATGRPVGAAAAAASAVAVVVAVAGVVAWRRRAVPASAVVLALLAGAAAGSLAAARVHRGPVSRLAEQTAVVRAEVVLRRDVRELPGTAARAGAVSADVWVLTVSGRGRTWRVRTPARVLASGPAAEAWRRVPVGSRLAVSARLAGSEREDDTAAVLRVRGAPVQVRAPSLGLRLVERVRAGLRRSVAGRPDEPRGLVPALVVGDTSGLDEALQADFRTTGLTHLTAVSGANLTLLLVFVLLLARTVGVRGWWLRLTGLITVLGFVALCRSEPSVVRAAAMGLVALAALGAGGRASGLRHLSLAALAILLVDPYLSRSVGFGLSVLATAGIVVWAGAWSGALHRWLPAVLADAVAVPLAAHLATLPVVAALSDQVSVAGLPANVLAGPLVGPATVLGFAAAGLSLLSPWPAALAGLGAAWCAQGIIAVAHVGARLPGAAWPVGGRPAVLVWLGAVALVAMLAVGWVLARPWLAAALAVALLAALLRPPVQPGWPPADWVLVACDVGQGDGLAVRSGAGQAVVVDTGPDPPAMDRCLAQLGVRRVPLLVLTHFHADHVDGLPAVLDRRRVGEIWVSPFASPAWEASEVATRAQRRQVRVATPAVGTRATVGGVSLQVLGPLGGGPGASAEDESSRQNDASLVLLVTVGGLRLLLTGDVEPPGQQALLAAGTDLRADVLKVPHHGSARQDRSFLAATGARVAIASAGRRNDYGHPAPRTVALLESLGMTVLHTDRDGSVAVAARAGRPRVVAQRAEGDQ